MKPKVKIRTPRPGLPRKNKKYLPDAHKWIKSDQPKVTESLEAHDFGVNIAREHEKSKQQKKRKAAPKQFDSNLKWKWFFNVIKIAPLRCYNPKRDPKIIRYIQWNCFGISDFGKTISFYIRAPKTNPKKCERRSVIKKQSEKYAKASKVITLKQVYLLC